MIKYLWISKRQGLVIRDWWLVRRLIHLKRMTTIDSGTAMKEFKMQSAMECNDRVIVSYSGRVLLSILRSRKLISAKDGRSSTKDGACSTDMASELAHYRLLDYETLKGEFQKSGIKALAFHRTADRRRWAQIIFNLQIFKSLALLFLHIANSGPPNKRNKLNKPDKPKQKEVKGKLKTNNQWLKTKKEVGNEKMVIGFNNRFNGSGDRPPKCSGSRYAPF